MTMDNSQNRRSEAELERLWQQYRQACGEPDGSPQFMPRLWDRIEARRSRFRIFERNARVFAAAAASLALVLGGFVLFEAAQESQRWHAESYIEVLSAENARNSPSFLEPAVYELDPSGRQDH